jgi:hypothetical protein
MSTISLQAEKDWDVLWENPLAFVQSAAPGEWQLPGGLDIFGTPIKSEIIMKLRKIKQNPQGK